MARAARGADPRYLGTYGSGRVRKAVLMGAIPPYLLKTGDNPEGVDQSVFGGIKAGTAARLPGLIKDLTFVTVQGGPHNIAWTHPDVVNPALLDFLAA